MTTGDSSSPRARAGRDDPKFAVRRRLMLAGLVLALLVAHAAIDVALAQGTPFGGPRTQAVPATGLDGIVAWLLAKQSEFYRALSGAIRASKSDGSALWGLFGISFAYGVFHAAGPGHGKAVISAYLFASGETLKKGIVLSFASALVQAVSAIASM